MNPQWSLCEIALTKYELDCDRSGNLHLSFCTRLLCLNKMENETHIANMIKLAHTDGYLHPPMHFVN